MRWAEAGEAAGQEAAVRVGSGLGAGRTQRGAGQSSSGSRAVEPGAQGLQGGAAQLGAQGRAGTLPDAE